MKYPKKKWVEKVLEGQSAVDALPEELIQGQVEEFLNLRGIEYRRIPDKIWFWLKTNAPQWITKQLIMYWRGKPDLLIMFPLEKGSYTVEIEIKTANGHMSQRQKKYSERMPVYLCRSYDECCRVICEAESFTKKLLHQM